MKLQTQVLLQKTKTPIDYDSQLLLLGSCFANNIGLKLQHLQFQHLSNPFGNLFHPLAITNLISNAITEKKYTAEDIFLQNERWHCFDAHSDLSDPSKESTLTQLNDGIEKTREQLYKSTHVIITLGTAWVYKHLLLNRRVANCHKIPVSAFEKELLSIEEITASLQQLVQAIKKINAKAIVVFTVSPVRHLKDGFVENQLSKAHLIASVHSVLKCTEATYFPAYELMMDELRDYRFYEADMVHPNALAVSYIWEKFKASWLSKDSYATMEKVKTVQSGLSHKPFNASSTEHQRFLKSLEEKITYLKKTYPFMDFSLRG